jgi:hypothetical protein
MMRMHMRRFTRLTNGSARKSRANAEVAPAMQDGLANHVWSM